MYNLINILFTYPKTIAKEIFLDVHLYKMTEPLDKSIFYAHRFLQKATFELLFAARFGDAKIGSAEHERVWKLKTYRCLLSLEIIKRNGYCLHRNGL